MIKDKVLDLIDVKKAKFKEIFSICIGDVYIRQIRFAKTLNENYRWDTDITKGILEIDEKEYKVEYIGTTSERDGCWFSANIETRVPKKYSNMISNIKERIKKLNIEEFSNDKILIQGDKNGHNLSIIYTAFANDNVAYFPGVGVGELSIFMFVKNLPKDIFRKISMQEFLITVPKLLAFEIDHKLMVKALLIQNDIHFKESMFEIKAEFDKDSFIKIKFDLRGRIKLIKSSKY